MSSEIRYITLEEALAFPIYPTADIFPMLLDKAEAPKSTQAMVMTLPAFADQLISDQGVKEPLVIWKGQLVDGRNRRAATALAIKALNEKEALTSDDIKALDSLSQIPVREEFFADEMEADRFIVALNVTRRQLTKSQMAAVAALYWPLYEGRGGRPTKDAVKDEATSGKTRDLLAKMFHVNRVYVETAHKLQISDPDNFRQLHEGRKTLSDTKKEDTIKSEVHPTKKAADGIANALTRMLEHLEVFKEYETTQVDWQTYGRELLHAVKFASECFSQPISDAAYQSAADSFGLRGEDDDE